MINILKDNYLVHLMSIEFNERITIYLFFVILVKISNGRCAGMAQVVAFVLQKGGTGKTTTVANTAYILAEAKKRTAVFDFDPQGNLSLAFGIDPDTLPLTILDVIMGDCELKKIRINKSGVDIYPSNDWLARFELLLITKPGRFPDPWNVLKNMGNRIIVCKSVKFLNG